MDGNRKGRYAKYNKLIEEAGEAPPGIAELGWEKYPRTFYWFETLWNPYTNPDYARYRKEYPFQVISGRVHHAMSGTQMVDWLGRIPTEDLWMPLNDERDVDEIVIGENGPEPAGRKVCIPKGTWSIRSRPGLAEWSWQMNCREVRLPLGGCVADARPLAGYFLTPPATEEGHAA